jgi:hypothetical protein
MPGETYFIDFLGKDLPISADGFTHALVVIDGFTRYPWVIPLKTKRVVEIAERLLTDILSHTSLPICVHSDNEEVLICEAFNLVYQKLGIRRTSSSLRHPQGNSPAERFMRYLNAALAITLPSYSEWPNVLPMILFAYRALPHDTTGYSPFFLQYGRHPLLPLHASTLPISNMSANTTDSTSYVKDMVAAMATVFETVRFRQDRISRANAARRDENEERYVSKYLPGDPILLYDPGSVSTLVTAARQEPPPTTLSVPQKWRMQWTGPHKVISQKGHNTYIIWHIRKRMLVTVNVADMRIFHPFLEIPFSGIPQVRRRRPRADYHGPTTPLRQLKGRELANEIKPDDLFIAEIPTNGYEPVALMRYLETTPQGIIAQWYGRMRLTWHINDRMYREQWLPAWIDPRDHKFYYKAARRHPTDLPFTNAGSEIDKVEEVRVVIFNFKLRNDLRLPRDVANAAIRHFRSMPVPTTYTGGVLTYENPANHSSEIPDFYE